MIIKEFKKNQNKIWKTSIKSLLIGMILSLVLTAVSFADGGGRYQVDPWSFGVMADTQWTNSEDPEGANPEYVSAALARAIENEFIDYGVKFVIQVGDLTDRAGDEGMAARAAAAQPLFDAGIGFFPLRGNHETYGYLYGRDPDWVVNVPGYKAAFPQTQGAGDYLFGATNFSKPSDIMTGVDIMDGLSYSFDYGDDGNNARFVVVDVEATSFISSNVDEDPAAQQYVPQYGEAWYYLGWIVYKATATAPGGSIPDGAYFRISSSGSPSTNFYGFDSTYPLEDWIAKVKYDIANTEFWPGMQQEWISTQLDKNTRGTEHAFVLSHRGLMGTNHADGFFGSSPASKSDTQNVFYANLVKNGVKYMLSGHDHLHNRAIVKSPDGLNEVQQIIHMAGSTKFYGPGSLDGFSGTKGRETEIAQDLYNVGYYVYTIDGPRVNVDYYADSTGNFLDNEDYPYGDDSVPERLYLPALDFVKKESFGYSTNGQQFLIPQGESYTVVEDSFGNTTAKILAGTNNSTTTDETPTVIDDNDTPDDPTDDITLSAPRTLTKVVNTGWVANPDDQDTPYRKHFWNRYWKKPWNKFWNKWYKNVVKNDLKSDILSIWGMSEIDEEGKTDTYVLSMSFDFNRMTLLGAGNIGIATYVDGKWKNAVNENFGGKKRFVVGKYKPKYGLGTYGIDPSTKTAWAVINYNADFAVAGGINNFHFNK